MKTIIVGQAPSRHGDGRPFSGISGKRLLSLLDFDDYDQLAEAFVLKNLLDEPKLSFDGSDFSIAKERAWHILDDSHDGQQIIACGNWVWNAFDCQMDVRWLESASKWLYYKRTITIWRFPHPSGLNHIWNTPSNIFTCSHFLKSFLIASPTD